MNATTETPAAVAPRKSMKSPVARFLIRAALILAFYLALHAAGFRSYTSILSGTMPQDGTGLNQAILYAVVYVAAYMAAVVAAPILAIAALLRYLSGRLFTS